MADINIERMKRSITDEEKRAIASLSGDNLKKRVADMDLKAAAAAMRRMNLGEAADKLETMTAEDIINQISKNPQVIDKLKNILK